MEVQNRVVTKKKKNREPLTEQERNFLRENYLYLSDDSLAEILGVASGLTIRKFRSNMNLKRNMKSSKEFIKEVPLVIWVQRELYDSQDFSNLVNISL